MSVCFPWLLNSNEELVALATSGIAYAPLVACATSEPGTSSECGCVEQCLVHPIVLETVDCQPLGKGACGDAGGVGENLELQIGESRAEIDDEVVKPTAVAPPLARVHAPRMVHEVVAHRECDGLDVALCWFLRSRQRRAAGRPDELRQLAQQPLGQGVGATAPCACTRRV